MSSVYDRLQYNFDTIRFGGATTLASNGANTLHLVANNTPGFKDWQKTDLAAGTSSNRANYFYNRAAPYAISMANSASSIIASAALVHDTSVSSSGSNLQVKVNSFKSHTDNISGVSIVTAAVPSYDNLSGLGQQNMLLLTKTDGTPANTVPIVGGFSSLFIQDVIAANAAALSVYAGEYAASIVCVTTGTGTPEDPYVTTCTSDYPTGPMISYMNSTATTLNNRVAADFAFFNNSLALAKESAFLQQFNSMGTTNTYLINNVVGTTSLKTKLASANT